MIDELDALAPELTVSEAEFGARFEDALDLCGWTWHHEPDSRRSRAGMPDYVAVRCIGDDRRIVFAELKRQKRYTVKEHQKHWLRLLEEVAEAVGTLDGFRPIEVHLWRPGDWPQIVEVLS